LKFVHPKASYTVLVSGSVAQANIFLTASHVCVLVSLRLLGQLLATELQGSRATPLGHATELQFRLRGKSGVSTGEQ
jgi:hypothetical protein